MGMAHPSWFRLSRKRYSQRLTIPAPCPVPRLAGFCRAWAGIGLVDTLGRAPGATQSGVKGVLNTELRQKSLRAFHPIHNSVMRFDVRVEQLQAIVVAFGPLGATDDDLGLGAVAHRNDRAAFDALADSLGLADQVVAGIAGHDSASFGVGAERQGPTVQQDVVGAQVEILLL